MKGLIVSEFKGTQGPWFVIEDHSHDDDNGNGPTYFAISVDEDDSVDAIAWMGDGAGTDIERANAHLIAAAPELLAVCIDLVDGEPCRYDHNEFCQEHYCSKPCKHEQARAAIAKALGSPVHA